MHAYQCGSVGIKKVLQDGWRERDFKHFWVRVDIQTVVPGPSVLSVGLRTAAMCNSDGICHQLCFSQLQENLIYTLHIHWTTILLLRDMTIFLWRKKRTETFFLIVVIEN